MKICKVCKKRTKKIAVLLCIYAHMGLLMQAYYKSAEINFQDYITLEADSHLSKYSAENVYEGTAQMHRAVLLLAA